MDPLGLPAVGTVDLSERERLTVKGPQAHWFLDQLLTNRIEGVAPGEGVEALLLSPKGRIIAITAVDCVGAEELLVGVDSTSDFNMASFLSSRIFSTQVEIEDVTESLGLKRLVGADASKVVSSILGSNPPVAEGSNGVGPDGTVVVARSKPVPGWDIWFPNGSEILEKAMSEARAVELDPLVWEAVRVAGGVLSFDADLSAGFLPQEAALERAVHFSKGCYLGQEAVAMAQRGRVKKRFRHLHFEGKVACGDVVYEGLKVGSVTSCTEREGPGFGLGPISTEVPLEALVVVGSEPGISARVYPIPGEVSGPQVPSARELRERLISGHGD